MWPGSPNWSSSAVSFLKPGSLFLGHVLSWIHFHEKLLLVCPFQPPQTQAELNAAGCLSFTVGLGLVQPSNSTGSLDWRKASP